MTEYRVEVKVVDRHLTYDQYASRSTAVAAKHRLLDEGHNASIVEV